jgi:hypothetical protein
MALLQKLLAKQKVDREKAQARLAKRREYAKATRERELALQNGLTDLPPLIAVAIEEQQTTQPEPTPVPVRPDASSAELVTRLEAIKDRIFRLHAVFAVSLSHDAAMEANRYLILFQDLALQLQAKDADALAALTLGHESLLLSPPVSVRQSIPLQTQRFVELRWEAMQSPARREPKPPAVPDGLDWLVG